MRCALIGFGAATLMQISGLQKAMERTVILVPGGVGETFLPVEWVAPWLIAIILVCLPWVIVRKARRKRVELVEQDLPLAMELLATLSEAGLGLETALGRILKTRLAGRPLANELRFYQCEFVGETSQLAPSGIERVAMLSQRNLLNRFRYLSNHQVT